MSDSVSTPTERKKSLTISRRRGETTQWTISVIPSSPLLVAELSGQSIPARILREKVHDTLSAAQATCLDFHSSLGDRGLGHHWLIVYISNPAMKTSLIGSLRAWGSDVSVGEGTDLAELVARYSIYSLDPHASISACELDPESSADDAVAEIARASSTILHSQGEGALRCAISIVFVAEGGRGLSDRAPLRLIDGAREVEEQLASFIDKAPDGKEVCRREESTKPVTSSEYEGVKGSCDWERYGIDIAPWVALEHVMAAWSTKVGEAEQKGITVRGTEGAQDRNTGQWELKTRWSSNRDSRFEELGMGYHTATWSLEGTADTVYE